jgi:hypothetical protein
VDSSKTFIIIGIIACIVIAILAAYFVMGRTAETKPEPAPNSLGSEVKRGVKILTDPEGVAKEEK